MQIFFFLTFALKLHFRSLSTHLPPQFFAFHCVQAELIKNAVITLCGSVSRLRLSHTGCYASTKTTLIRRSKPPTLDLNIGSWCSCWTEGCHGVDHSVFLIYPPYLASGVSQLETCLALRFYLFLAFLHPSKDYNAPACSPRCALFHPHS